MRKAMLATIVLALSGAMAVGTAALLPEMLGASTCFPPPQQHNFSLATSRNGLAPQRTSGKSGLPPAKGAIAASTTTAAQEWAERMFTGSLSKDFGAVPFGTQLLHRFEITNIHAVPVEITGFRLGCGCVTATPGKRILRPGERTTIDVAFDTREFTGPNTQTIRVSFGPNPRTNCVIKVSAVSQTDLVFEPDRVNFGEVPHGQVSVGSTDIEYHGPSDWKIKEVIVAKDSPFVATVTELFRRPGRIGYRLDVALTAGAPSGRIRDFIYLKTNQSGVPPVPVLVTANVQAPQGVSSSR